jgi:hypothetical protein
VDALNCIKENNFRRSNKHLLKTTVSTQQISSRMLREANKTMITPQRKDIWQEEKGFMEG